MHPAPPGPCTGPAPGPREFGQNVVQTPIFTETAPLVIL